ncbi:hypothetical protein Q9L58_002325 [Maublancomyces gigas]|uniref:Cerato-platanin n=1 Tax=Discina gigas TaxID=1032678 RepID=A0ABR3GRQ2_9PEZI
MQFSAVVISLVAAATTAFAQNTATVAYTTVFDDASVSTLNVACSDGINGLATKGFPTLGSLPKFPFIAASSQIAGWNSPNCGKCYSVTYGPKTVFVIAVDRAVDGFVMSKGAMDALTDGQATMLGRIQATWAEAPASSCGF